MASSRRHVSNGRSAVTFVGYFLVACAHAQDIISSGRGYGTYYYDVKNVAACGSNFANMNTGYVRCGNKSPLRLSEINSNYVVAMNNTELGQDLRKYCGKKVVVTVNGQRTDLPLFIGDGCERCGIGSPSGPWVHTGAPGLDFSYSVLNELSSQACAAGHVDLAWEIVDETLYQFHP